MHYNFVTVLLLILTTETNAANNSSKFTLIVNGVFVINDTASSSEFNVSSVYSDRLCIAYCETLGCSVSKFNETSRVCQIFSINDESSGRPGPKGSHLTRQLSSPNNDATKLWKFENFEQQLLSRVFLRIFTKPDSSTNGRNGSVQYHNVPFSGCYRIEAFGAAGGSVSLTYTGRGGRGASASGSFWINAGTRLDIVVGQTGGDSACGFGAGGGGGSFVYISNGTDSAHLLVAAGGGGGASWNLDGVNGSSSVNGTDSFPGDGHSGPGGAAGQPGRMAPTRYPASNDSCGGPGAGWSDSATPSLEFFPTPGGPGLSRIDGWLGGARNASCTTGDGGFGGGGAGGGCCQSVLFGSGGGGGGFSGGGTGSRLAQSGGGGGSFCSGFSCVTVSGANSEPQGRVLLSMSGACE